MTGDPEADRLLDDDPFALLTGMLLDQQVPMEVAFAGPHKIAQRMGGLDVHRVAEGPPAGGAARGAPPPAGPRVPRALAGPLQPVAAKLVEDYDGDVTRLWTDGAPDGPEVLRRLRALPGFGDAKARIFLALLGKQRGVQPAGWREAAGDYGDEGARRSIADVTGAESLAEVRATKKAAKAAAKRG